MRALTYAAFGGPLSVTDVPDPVAPPGGAVVRVEASGLCRSDWHGWLGHDTDIVGFPHIPGHEFAGSVESVGDGVDRGWVGRRVTAPFVFACGACPVCRVGDGQVCPHQRLGCRVATAYRAVTVRADVQAGESVVVLGCGGVGLSAVAAAVARGADVIAVDLSADSLAAATALGARHGLLQGDDLPERVHDLTGGGAHVSIKPSVLTPELHARFAAAGAAPIPMDRVIAWELDVLGSHGMDARAYPALLDDVRAGRIPLASMLDGRGPLGLEAAAKALPDMGSSFSRGIVLVDPTR